MARSSTKPTASRGPSRDRVADKHEPGKEPSTMTAQSTDDTSDRIENLPALLTVPRAAKLLGLTRSAAYRCAALGELPTQRLGGRVYVITAAIRPLLDGTGKLVA